MILPRVWRAGRSTWKWKMAQWEKEHVACCNRTNQGVTSTSHVLRWLSSCFESGTWSSHSTSEPQSFRFFRGLERPETSVSPRGPRPEASPSSQTSSSWTPQWWLDTRVSVQGVFGKQGREAMSTAYEITTILELIGYEHDMNQSQNMRTFRFW